MANWSYNGVVLPEFPTEFGAYTNEYTKRVIVWEEKRQRWYALASSKVFVVQRGRDNLLGLFATDYHGQYYCPLGETKWVYVGNHYRAGPTLYFEDENGYEMIWSNHDIINQEDGSVWLHLSDPVSPGSAITKLEVNAAELRLNCGESFQFEAEVEGTGIYSSRVYWDLNGNDARGGTTLTENGLLTVGETEHSSVFTVTVTSRQDTSVSKEIPVTVADYRSKLSMGMVTDLWSCNGEPLPEFPTDFGEYSDSYTYRVIVWEEKRQRWYALASARRFELRDHSGGFCLYATDYHGQYYCPLGGTGWEYVDSHYSSGAALPFGDAYGYRMVWANHDIINRVDNSVFFRESEPVRLCTPVTVGEDTVYQIIGSTVWLDGACIHLNTTDAVYTVKAWLYRTEDGLNIDLPPTWTGEVFGGPDWQQRISFSGLMPFTSYGVYAVVCVDGVATDHFCHASFTTLQADQIVRLAVEAAEVTGTGFTLSVSRWGLQDAVEYIAEILVYMPGSGRVVFAGECAFVGNGTDPFKVTGLEPNTRNAVSADVYPAPMGAVVVRGDYEFSTAGEQTLFGVFAGVGGRARSVREIYVGVSGRARKVKAVYLGVGGRAQPLKGK